MKRKISFSILAMIISLIISISYFDLWGTDINVPLTGYRSDSVGVLLEATNYCRGGNVRNNVLYGAPDIDQNVFLGGIADSSVPIVLIKPLSKLLGSIEAAVNMQAILNIILLTLATYVMCISLGLGPLWSAVSSIIYANCTFFVMCCNTLLIIYGFAFYIPIVCFLVIKLSIGNQKEFLGKKQQRIETIFVFCLMFFAGINSAYYAFFILLLLVFAIFYSLFGNKNIWSVILIIESFFALILGIAWYTIPNILKGFGIWGEKIDNMRFNLIFFGAAIVCLILIIKINSWLYRVLSMKTLYIVMGVCCIFGCGLLFLLSRYTDYMGEAFGRTLLEVELGAMKIYDAGLPALNNVFRGLNHLLITLVDTKGCDFFMMGIFVGVGYMYSIFSLFSNDEQRNKQDAIVRICGYYNCLLTFLSVKGGLSTIVASVLTTGIRNYNRIYIFVGLFSLISFSILMERSYNLIQNRINQRIFQRIALVLISFIVLVGGISSIPSYFVFEDTVGLVSYEQRKKEYDDWQDFIGRVEQSVTSDSMILELPINVDEKYFGEMMTKGRAYELSVPAIISKHTTWSYGGNIGIDDTNASVRSIIQEAVDMGFRGIYVDTLMYHDDSYEVLLEEMTDYLGEPVVCNENRRYFYSLEKVVRGT